MNSKFLWFAQPLSISSDSEILDSTRLHLLLFWKHSDALFVAFFISFFLAVGALVFFLKAYRGQPLFFLVAVVLAVATIGTWVKLSAGFWSDPLRQVQIQKAYVRPCKVVAADFEYKDTPGLWVRLQMRVKLDVEFEIDSKTHQLKRVPQFLPRFFRALILEPQFPRTGWIWHDPQNGETVLLGIKN